MSTLDEKAKIEYSPGDIIYADSNFSDKYDCFGVVVDRDFWMEQAEKENVFKKDIQNLIKNGVFDRHVLFRVLGTKAFRQYWRENDCGEFEPNEEVVMNYRCQAKVYVVPVNLRPLIELSKLDNNRVGRLLFRSSTDYVLEALDDAEIIYRYLDGERFDSSKDHIFREDKLLRLLEKAIPLEKI